MADNTASSGHGGFRRGAGRHCLPKERKLVPIPVWLPQWAIKRLTTLGDKQEQRAWLIKQIEKL